MQIFLVLFLMRLVRASEPCFIQPGLIHGIELIYLKYACLHVFPHFYKKVGLKKFRISLRISVTTVNLQSLNVHRVNQKQGMKRYLLQ